MMGRSGGTQSALKIDFEATTTNLQTNERTNERTNEQTNERTKTNGRSFLPFLSPSPCWTHSHNGVGTYVMHDTCWLHLCARVCVFHSA